MARLEWGASGSRLFEMGLDRGIFFLGTAAGVPWNGLISVSEGSGSASPRPFYLDGIKYLNLSTAEDFAATLESYYAPEGFDECDGHYAIAAGLFATEQPRKTFALSYRTLIGNDTDAELHGYKIHLVYNILATASARNRKTLSDSVEPTVLSWDLATKPPVYTGYRPTAHYIIDSRYADSTALATFEGILYGDSESDSRLPDPDELVTIFGG